jgi:hypothetical protein
VVYEKALGPEHPYTAISLSKLGWNLDNQGRHTEAERRTGARWRSTRRSFQPANWHTTVSRSLLASCLDGLHQHVEAEPLHRQALAELEAALGECTAESPR